MMRINLQRAQRKALKTNHLPVKPKREERKRKG
jgi:hypothetical protein